MIMEEYKPEEKVDTSIMDAAMKIKEDQINAGMKQSPEDVIDLELKIREGKGHKGEIYEVDGVKIHIPQLSVIQRRKANREGLKHVGTTILGKKIIFAMRSKANQDSEVDLTFDETLELQEATDIEDVWLVVYALRDVHHPKMTMDDEKDFAYVEYLDCFVDLVDKVRKHNGLSEGAEEVKFFRDNGSRGIPEKGDTSY